MTTENGISAFVRPNKMEDLVGLDHIKNTVHYDIEGSIKLNQPFPSYIISGPPGTGKSTTANIIASKIGGNVFTTIGSEFKNPESIHLLAAQVKDKDLVFIEEAHTISKQCQVILLEWIENFKLLGAGDMNAGIAPKVVFVLPTTNSNLLTKALRERCKILYTSYYKINQLKDILLVAGTKIGIDLSSSDEALTLLAQSSRGTPRVAVMHRLDSLRKIMAVDNLPYNVDTVRKLFHTHKINEWGLEHSDIIYCNILYDKLCQGYGRPVSQKILQQTTGLEMGVLENIVESYLNQIGAIQIVSGGRILTEFGMSLIGKHPIIKENKRDDNKVLEELNLLLKEEENIKGGMKIIAPKLGLKYGKDNDYLRFMIAKAGYKVKQSIGLVKNS